MTHTHLNFQNYCSNVILSNTSSHPQFIRKGVCVGFLFCGSLSKDPQLLSSSLRTPFGVTGSSGNIPVSFGSHTDKLVKNQNSFGVTGSSGKTCVSSDFDIDNHVSYQRTFGVPSYSGPTPVARVSNIDNIACHNLPTYLNRNVFCNNVRLLNPAVEENIRTLVQKTENQQQQDQLYSLLVRFHPIFDITKHNIANTPINHVINTIPHSPPACRPYPQPDKEETMYKLIQEFLQALFIDILVSVKDITV